MSDKMNGASLAIAAAASLAVAGALSQARTSSRSLPRGRAGIADRLRMIEEGPDLDPEHGAKVTQEYFAAMYGEPSDLPVFEPHDNPLGRGKSMATSRAAAETGARRIREELAHPDRLGKPLHQLSEKERFHKSFLEQQLFDLEDEFGQDIGKTPLRSRAYRSFYEDQG